MARVIAFISPRPRPEGEPALNVRAEAAITARRLRESSQASRDAGSHIREIARPIQELLREMGQRNR